MAIQSQPSRIPEPFAGSGTKNVIPATNAAPSASQAASWASGFPPECSQPISAGGCPVPRNDVNGVLSQLSQDYAFRQDGGIWAWSALADYDTQRMVRGADGKLYWSVAQSGPNTGAGAVDPTTDNGTCWGALPAATSGTAAMADALATPRKIDGVAFNGTSDIVHFGESSTAGSTAEKTVSCPGFALQAGARIAVKFQNENTSSSLLLNVESTGAKAVYAHGAAVSSGLFKAGCVYDFVYDGAQYQLLNNGDSVPAGTVLWLSTPTVPAGYLLCNGAAVGRATYPELFAAIGTTYGAGDGSTTFNLPNLIDRFAQGSTLAGTVKDAGLPNITGNLVDFREYAFAGSDGAFNTTSRTVALNSLSIGGPNNRSFTTNFSASRSNAIYGNSSTVQPPALTLVPCIRYA